MTKLVAAALAALLFGGSSAYSAEPPRGTLAEQLRGRVSIGTRLTAFALADTHSAGTNREAGETFIGFIDELEALQNHRLPKLFVSFLATPWLGLELAFDRVKARTWNANTDFSDGTVSASGIILSAVLRYPNATIFTPYAGLGLAFWDARFDEEPWWQFGYDSPEDWVADGSPYWPTHHINKTFRVENDFGVVFEGGLDLYLNEHWSIDLLMRYADLEIDARYYRNAELRRTGSFPLSHTAYGVGVRYTF